MQEAPTSSDRFLLKALGEAAGELRNLLWSTGERQAREPGDGPDEGWCLLAIAVHLRDVEQQTTRQFETILRRPYAPISNVDLDDIPFPEDYEYVSLDEAVSAFGYARQETSYSLWGLVPGGVGADGSPPLPRRGGADRPRAGPLQARPRTPLAGAADARPRPGPAPVRPLLRVVPPAAWALATDGEAEHIAFFGDDLERLALATSALGLGLAVADGAGRVAASANDFGRLAAELERRGKPARGSARALPVAGRALGGGAARACAGPAAGDGHREPDGRLILRGRGGDGRGGGAGARGAAPGRGRRHHRRGGGDGAREPPAAGGGGGGGDRGSRGGRARARGAPRLHRHVQARGWRRRRSRRARLS